MKQLLTIFLLCNSFWVCAADQQGQRVRIHFLLDASYSMKRGWSGGTRWDYAVKYLSDIADSVAAIPGVEIGLRVFGHQYNNNENNCKDSRLEVPPGPKTTERIKSKLNTIKPRGITPLAYSIDKAAEDLTDGDVKTILILITDGEESCDGDLCESLAILERNRVILRPVVIGISLPPSALKKLDCVKEVSNSFRPDEFGKELGRAVYEAISKTTLQINLNDQSGKPVETNVPITLHDAETGIVKYSFIHTLNARGKPDTLTVSPAFKYKATVHSIPPVEIPTFSVNKNEHNVVSADCPQGALHLDLQGVISRSAVVDRIKAIIKKKGSRKTLHVQRVNSIEKYITGTYELEVLTLPRIKIENVAVEQGKITHVKIPAPGLLTINKTFDAFGAIFTTNTKGEQQKLYDLKPTGRQETVALQPGKYRIVYRSKFAKTIHTTVDKEFEVSSGGSLSIKL